MECYKTEKMQEQDLDLTDSSYWKPIYEEIKRIQEQREILKANVCSMGVKLTYKVVKK
jgi:hypothetical protein